MPLPRCKPQLDHTKRLKVLIPFLDDKYDDDELGPWIAKNVELPVAKAGVKLAAAVRRAGTKESRLDALAQGLADLLAAAYCKDADGLGGGLATFQPRAPRAKKQRAPRK